MYQVLTILKSKYRKNTVQLKKTTFVHLFKSGQKPEDSKENDVTTGITECVRALIPTPVTQEANPVFKCGLGTIGYYEVPSQVPNPSVKKLCKLVNLVAMYKPFTTNMNVKDKRCFQTKSSSKMK